MSGFGPEDLLAAACQGAGLDDFGGDEFRTPLALVARSLDTEAPLTPAGRQAHRERLIATLAGRLRMFAWIGRHPEILREEIAPPVVIAGLPRTGTTMLYRMLAAAGGLSAPLNYEALDLSPASDWDFTATNDARIPAAEARVAAMMAAMPDLASIYPFEAMAPEESIYLYAGSFLSTSQQSAALIPAYDAWFADADKTPAYRYLKTSLQFLQWQRRRSERFADGTRWLLKTPDHIHGLQELLEVFPGAHIIQTHRDPIQTIPSICSFIRVLHAPATARDDAREIGEAWSRMFAHSLGRAASVRAAQPDRFLDVWYRDTVGDPRKVAEQAFAFIGQPLTDEGWAEMQRWRDANRREERPLHSYTLEEFGLSETLIRDRFREYRETYIEGRMA